MAPLPAAYAWLREVEGLPRMVKVALPLYGVLEAPGEADNPVILGWAAEVGLDKTYRHDATPWCGLWLALVCKRAGKPVPPEPLWALNWARWGVPGTGALGDVLVFVRPGGGHVGLYVGEDAACYHVLGGNTRDSVSIARLSRDRLRAIRQPSYKVVPSGAVRKVLAPTGAPSTDEA